MAESNKSLTLIIVDYNNAVSIPGGENFGSRLLSRLSEIVSLSLRESQNVTGVNIRLYGGWYEDGVFTSAASRISHVIDSEPFFPIKSLNRNNIHGSIDMPASSMANPMRRWVSLFKQGTGTPRLQLCPSIDTRICDTTRDQCPIHALRKFSQSKGKQCPVQTCDRTNADVFRQSKQKKVDVMMASDIVTAAIGTHDSYQLIAVFTDDTDLYPALVDAANHHKNVVLFKPKQARADHETEILLSAGVSVRLAQ